MLQSNRDSEILQDKELEKVLHDTSPPTPPSEVGEVPIVTTNLDRKNNNDNNVPIQTEEPQEDVIPNGGYGWVCVATCFVINAHTWGMNSSYGVFLNYYLNNNTFPGASRTAYAFIGGLSMAMAVLISPIITVAIRKFGTRTCLFVGVFFQTVSFIGASFADQIWQLVLSQGICFGFGLGFLFVGSVGVVPQWFSTRRSLANGVAAAGSGLGGLMYSLAANAMIQRIGLAWAFRILGIISFVVNSICAILLRDRNKQVGSSHLAFDIRLFKRWEFWALLGFGVFSMLGYVVLLFSIPNYAHQIGLSAKQGSVIGAILSLGQGLGRPPMGYFSDSIGRINMAGLMTFLCGFLVLAVWISAKSYGVLIFFAVVGGTVAGTYWTTVAPVTTEIIGLKDLPSALSITWVFLTLPMLVSEPIGLEIVAINEGSYLGAQVFCGVMYIAAALCLWALKVWKLGQLELEAAKNCRTHEEAKSAQTRSELLQPPAIRKRSTIVHRMVRWTKV